MPLFNPDGTYTGEANLIANDIMRSLQPFFAKQEYSTREMFALVTLEAVGAMGVEQIARGMRIRRARRAAVAGDPVVDVQHE
jgi:hypothetical protein